VLNISVSSTRWGEPPRLLNYLSAPNAVVWAAVAASCAFPGLYEPVRLSMWLAHVNYSSAQY
jgi:TAG lipase/steryl ester hydrolase/phospholipase A2/LPA acyltransferase